MTRDPETNRIFTLSDVDEAELRGEVKVHRPWALEDERRTL